MNWNILVLLCLYSAWRNQVLASSVDFIEPLFMHGYLIKDLILTKDGLQLDAEPWIIKLSNGTAPSSKILKCDSFYFLGSLIMGYESYVERTYSPLISHRAVVYSIKLIVDKLWRQGQNLFVEIDGSNIFDFDPSNYFSSPAYLGKCDNQNPSYEMFINGKIEHSNNSLTLRLRSKGSGWFGMRRMILLLRSDISYNLPQGCILGFSSGSNSSICGCQPDASNLAGGVCSVCDQSCRSCLGSLDSECIVCSDTYSYNGLKCVKTCPSNCGLCNPLTNQCSSCNQNYFLYWNYTCNPTCQSPFQEKTLETLKLCKTPCQPDRFMLWNNSCSDFCDFPLISRLEGEAKFCNHPCDSSTNGEYLYWNGSCLETCKVNSRYEGEKRFCDACQTGYYLYQNNTCLTTCNLPLISRTEGKYSFCDSPCKNNTLPYYYTEENICNAKCEYPYSIKEDLLCILNLSQDELKQVQTLNDVSNVGEQSLTGAATVGSIISFSNPQAFSLVTLTKMLQYIKYIRVKYSPKLQKCFKMQKSESGLSKWAPKMPDALKAKFTYHQLPENFEQYHLHSSFMVNFWKPLLTLSIILALTLFTILLVKCSTRVKALNSICKKVEQVLKWNFSIMFFTTFYDDILIYTSLDLMTSDLDSFFPILSCLTWICVNGLTIFVFIKSILVIHSIQKDKRSSRNLNISQGKKHNEEKWKDYEVLFSICKDTSFFTQGFILFFMTRVYLFSLVLGYLYDYPLVQAIIITSLSVIFILYLMVLRPLKEILKLWQYIAQETIILVVNICVLILAITDKNHTENYKLRQITSDTIIYSNTCFLVLSPMFLVLQTLTKLWELYRARKSAKMKKVNQAKRSVISEQPASKLFVEPIERARGSRTQKRIQNSYIKTAKINKDRKINIELS